MMTTALFLVLSGLLQTGVVQPTAGASRKIVGYYAVWTAERYPLADIPADKLTHVNYAFGKIDADNKLTFNRAIAVDRVYPIARICDFLVSHKSYISKNNTAGRRGINQT